MDRLTVRIHKEERKQFIGVLSAMNPTAGTGKVSVVVDGDVKDLSFCGLFDLKFSEGQVVLVEAMELDWENLEYLVDCDWHYIVVVDLISLKERNELTDNFFEKQLAQTNFGVEHKCTLESQPSLGLRLVCYALPVYLSDERVLSKLVYGYDDLLKSLDDYISAFDISKIIDEYKIDVEKQNVANEFELIYIRSNAVSIGVNLFDLYMDQFAPHLSILIERFSGADYYGKLDSIRNLWQRYAKSVQNYMEYRIENGYRLEEHHEFLKTELEAVKDRVIRHYKLCCQETYVGIVRRNWFGKDYFTPKRYEDTFGYIRGYWNDRMIVKNRMFEYRDAYCRDNSRLRRCNSPTGFPIFFRPSDSLIEESRKQSLELRDQ